MASEKPSAMLPASSQTARHLSPSPQGLRQRPLGRATTFAEGHTPLNRRQSSFISETLSETRRSLRSSTDDIFLPRAKGQDDQQDDEDSNHWHSAPLVLALLPAVGGMFFTNGSAFITDVTLLAMAAIFMNWALRSPWDWYRAAQCSVIVEPTSPSIFTPIEEDNELEIPPDASTSAVSDHSTVKARPALKINTHQRADASAAQRELRFHESIALFCCFACPLMAAWLLHTIRSQLTRPSEGLVSDYNLTIFILVAEVRPSAHLIKLIQRRTLSVQRRVHADTLFDSKRAEKQQLRELSGRLEELEAHVANRIAGADPLNGTNGEELAAKASALATSDVKKTVQPELDALNRAMRRYEKRITISSVQVEARLQDLETRLNDVVSLAAAAQRHADRKSDNYANILFNWVCGTVVVPVQWVVYVSSIPGKVLSSATSSLAIFFTKRAPKDAKTSTPREQRSSRKGTSTRTGERERRVK